MAANDEVLIWPREKETSRGLARSSHRSLSSIMEARALE